MRTAVILILSALILAASAPLFTAKKRYYETDSYATRECRNAHEKAQYANCQDMFAFEYFCYKTCVDAGILGSGPFEDQYQTVECETPNCGQGDAFTLKIFCYCTGPKGRQQVGSSKSWADLERSYETVCLNGTIIYFNPSSGEMVKIDMLIVSFMLTALLCFGL